MDQETLKSLFTGAGRYIDVMGLEELITSNAAVIQGFGNEEMWIILHDFDPMTGEEILPSQWQYICENFEFKVDQF